MIVQLLTSFLLLSRYRGTSITNLTVDRDNSLKILPYSLLSLKNAVCDFQFKINKLPLSIAQVVDDFRWASVCSEYGVTNAMRQNNPSSCNNSNNEAYKSKPFIVKDMSGRGGHYNNGAPPNPMHLPPLDEAQLHVLPAAVDKATAHLEVARESYEVSERLFMSMLIKHTIIALIILIPLALLTTMAHAEMTENRTVIASINSPSNINTATSNTVDINNIAVATDIKKTGGLNNDADNAASDNSDSRDTMAHHIQFFAHQENIDITSNSRAEITLTNEAIDLEKYAGKWYEIARLPMYFQRKCVEDVTATYTLMTDADGEITSIDVLNECRKANKDMIVANGVAVPDNSKNTELKVTFMPSWLRWLPIGKADYWIWAIEKSDTDTNAYDSVLVGTPDKKYLWILSRQPQLAAEKFAIYKELADSLEYDVRQLNVTAHSGSGQTIVNEWPN